MSACYRQRNLTGSEPEPLARTNETGGNWNHEVLRRLILCNWNQVALQQLKYTARKQKCHTKDHHKLKWNLDGVRSQHSQPANTLSGWQGWKQNCSVRLRLHKTDMYWNGVKCLGVFKWIFDLLWHFLSLISFAHLDSTFETSRVSPVAVAFRKWVSASGAGGRPWPWQKPV